MYVNLKHPTNGIPYEPFNEIVETPLCYARQQNQHFVILWLYLSEATPRK